MGLGRWLFGRGQTYRGILVGLDYTGKTTLLCRLKLGKSVQTIPTIGFNIETIAHHSGSAFELWDIGGCDQMRRLVGNYITDQTFVLFVHDCTDRERIDEATEELKSILEMMKQNGSRYIWILLNKQDSLVLNERDNVLRETCGKFASVIAAYGDQIYVKILVLPGFSAKRGTQMNAMLDEIQSTLAGSSPSTSSARTVGAHGGDRPDFKSPTEKELRDRIRTSNAAALSADAFWAAFVSGQLEVWDHYAHLRAGYFVMLEQPLSGKGIFQCSEAFIAHLERLRAMNPQRFRNTTHRTMTVFWVVMLFRAATAYQALKGLSSCPGRDQFSDVLSHSPYLMDSHLWAKYYSKSLLFTPEAKESWQPPDVQPFPVTAAELESPDSNAGYVSRTSENESERLLEFGFTVAQSAIKSGVRRGLVVKQALETLQTSTIRLRAADQAIPPYSETKAYFWIQLVDASLRSSMEAESSEVVSAMTFDGFKKTSGLVGSEWQQYYSANLWESVGARMSFANPDLKPLPSRLGTRSS